MKIRYLKAPEGNVEDLAGSIESALKQKILQMSGWKVAMEE